MKKFIVAIAVLIIAASVQAELTDGDFTGTGFTALDNDTSLKPADIDAGWGTLVEGVGDFWNYDAVNNEAVRAVGFEGAVCQVFTSAKTGTQLIATKWRQGAAGTACVIRVYGITLNAPGFWKLYYKHGNTPPVVKSGATSTLLDEYGVYHQAFDGTTTLTCDFGTGYDLYIYSFQSKLDGTPVVEEVVFIPEPTIIGLLGLGVLAFIRRK